MKSRCFLLAAIFASFLFFTANALNICIPGGTGKLGQAVASKLSQHKVTVLSRNAFLASTPSRVSNDFGWMGQAFLDRNPHVSIRDWDGGDLLDIVGCDWMGWQQDALKPADVVINLVGGYTN
jgi:nucleoside-diphosphate-sugar epimerase